MKIKDYIRLFVMAFALGGFMFACNQEAQRETEQEANKVETEMDAAADDT
ncbi:hypothetical protein H8S95_06305 [Pontibacter sp. KCTC 32443]|nr:MULTISPECIES: hypothetical protein [Pontibacter]MBC5773667.1 hypothetical protein [Pontibacter sp. KCTC 32443]